jgi:hypothetical protein
LSFKCQFLKIERFDEIENRKQLFGEVGDAKINAQAEMAEA